MGTYTCLSIDSPQIILIITNHAHLKTLKQRQGSFISSGYSGSPLASLSLELKIFFILVRMGIRDFFIIEE